MSSNIASSAGLISINDTYSDLRISIMDNTPHPCALGQLSHVWQADYRKFQVRLYAQIQKEESLNQFREEAEWQFASLSERIYFIYDSTLHTPPLVDFKRYESDHGVRPGSYYNPQLLANLAPLMKILPLLSLFSNYETNDLISLRDIYPVNASIHKDLDVKLKADGIRNSIKQKPYECGRVTMIFNFRRKNLSNIPIICPEITSFRNLTWLTIETGSFTTLPQYIQELTNLEVIRLVNHRFSIFPKALLRCQKLIYIDFEKNKFEKFPEELFTFPHLRSVHLNNNSIAALPDDYVKCTSFELTIWNNKITKLPTDYEKIFNTDKDIIGLLSNPLEKKAWRSLVLQNTWAFLKSGAAAKLALGALTILVMLCVTGVLIKLRINDYHAKQPKNFYKWLLKL